MALILGIILIPALALAGVGQAQAQPLQVSPVPIWGIVLGTIIVAGLLYLVVHGPDDVYYSRNPQERCGHPQEQPCPNNTPHQ